MASPELQDACVRRILAVSLSQCDPSTPGSLLVHLPGLAEEMLTDAMGDASALLLNRENADRALVARLIESPPDSHPQTPLQYLIGCYSRATEEARQAPLLAPCALGCKELIVSYSTLCLGGGIIPHTTDQAQAAEATGGLQLLDSLDASMGYKAARAGAVPMPPGYLEDLAAKFASDENMQGLQEVLCPVAKELARRAKSCSALGEFSVPLSTVRRLVSIEPIAKALVELKEFLPPLKEVTGRGIESPGSSWLGPCFCPSIIDDPLVKGQPNVGDQCFAGADGRRQGDFQQAFRTLHLSSKQVQGELGGIIKVLINNKSTRSTTINWLAATIEGNAERGKMQWNHGKGASHGFFLNHNAIMLQLSAPFLDSPNFWKRVNARYVAAHNSRLNFLPDAKLGLSDVDDVAWREQVAADSAAASAGSPSGPPEHHFICECFFMTLKSLHFGLLKMIDDFEQAARHMGQNQRQVEELDAQEASMQGSPMLAVFQRQVQSVRQNMKTMKDEYYSMNAVVQDADFMTEVLAFYRLVASWLLSVASGGANGVPVSGATALPATPPLEFTSLPEWFLEDLIDMMIFVSRHVPQLLMGAKMDEVMMLILAFIDQPKYVRSTHLRAKMAELLHVWLPQDDAQQQGRRAPRDAVSTSLSHMFQAHPLVIERLLPALLRLYVDVEAMDVQSAFYEKFLYRQYIGEILKHLWELPPHRAAWKKFAVDEGTGTAGYVRFANMLITDLTFLLDDSLKKVGEIKTYAAKLADPAQRAALPPKELREMQLEFEHVGGTLRALLGYAHVTISVIDFSTEEITATFLLPEMVSRTGETLDYFLSLLTGPKRKELALKEPEKYNFKPRELLHNLIHVYLHLSSADRSGAFHAAIAGDNRSYSVTMFAEAARVLASGQMLSPVEAARLDTLDSGVQRAAAQMAAEEDLMKDIEIPDEFQDPLMAELMVDPVLLPTSNYIMDRRHIVRHLLTDQRDPMSRASLTPDMLIPQPELKARIDAWVKETLASQATARSK